MDKSLIWSGLVHTPVPILKFLAKVASTLHYHMDRRHVEECQKMVQATEKGWNEVKIVKSMYHSLWQIPADMSYFGKISENELFEVIQELDHFLEFLKSFPEDKGVIFVAAHLGPWEICAQTISRLFRPTISIFKPSRHEWINRFFQAARHRHRQTTVPKDGGMLPLFKHLKRGGSIGLVMDQHGGVDGSPSEFLGKPCSSWDSAALLAAKTQCPIVAVGIIRDGKKYRFLYREPISPPPSQKGIDLNPWVRQIDLALSSMIEEAPEQWMWLGRRWGRDFQGRMAGSL
jgi:lauroyl/myristoyl acyltransferase